MTSASCGHLSQATNWAPAPPSLAPNQNLGQLKTLNWRQIRNWRPIQIWRPNKIGAQTKLAPKSKLAPTPPWRQEQSSDKLAIRRVSSARTTRFRWRTPGGISGAEPVPSGSERCEHDGFRRTPHSRRLTHPSHLHTATNCLATGAQSSQTPDTLAATDSVLPESRLVHYRTERDASAAREDQNRS